MPRIAREKEEDGYIQVGNACWVRDPSGLWHFQNEHAMGDVWGAARIAISRPAPGPSWFWFNNEPVPIYRGDTEDSLVGRWHHWSAMLEENGKNAIMGLLKALPREGARSR